MKQINLELNKSSIKKVEGWKKAGIELPEFDFDNMSSLTSENPTWVHFGAGNIFRGFIAVLQQTLLNSGIADTGIVAVEGYDYEIIDKIYTPYDNLSLLVTMKPDGSLDKKVIGSIGESLVCDYSREDNFKRLQSIFSNPSLSMVSFTITEKGYSLKNITDKDVADGLKHPRSVIAKVASLMHERYKSGELPVALVSMDNCSHNGEKLYNAINAIVEKWANNGLVEKDFLKYINNPNKVSFPWSMIDKITPRPSDSVKKTLSLSGFDSTDIVITKGNTYIAPFVNAEGPQYLVLEDSFPNGRMPLEKAGVFFTDRETVERVEKMKVCTCLNPLHTALAIFGCLLGFNLIADEMKDPALKKLVENIGYIEGMPVVVNPKIFNPEDFIREVIEVRLPNPYIPDTPQRIVSDTSQKIGIRFGETIKSYIEREDLDPKSLKYIPLAIAGWCRYLMAKDDNGKEMELSPDPLLNKLKAYVSDIKLSETENVGNKLKPILSNEEIFGLNLYTIGLGEKVENYFNEMIAGVGTVRLTLNKYVNCK
ncbi:mannitol dehydrogenase family protein [Clostridium estertheticum]|uniref:mannitol dehydrogenase family protein n=1 Tax=Clostridium estertheticum TaxID=238834 RepID=UPI001C0AA0FD|nr:mannitol dehydrogenase family protein [Clostridium estertheticum]MBU3201725.1 mannitol dehydrogenase family protein [Clostridium estertheticum]WAG67145.1 mannitol dehydrogenase family protein [Clostridium estertheticum]